MTSSMPMPVEFQAPARPLLMKLAFALLWLFIFTIPSEKSIQIEGVGTISKMVGIAAMGAAVLAIACQGRFRKPSPIHIALGAFFAWASLTYFWTLSVERSDHRVTLGVQLFLVVMLIWEFAPREAYLLYLLEAYVLGTLPSSLLTLGRFLSGQDTYYQRYATDGFDPNDLALTLALSIPISYYVFLRRSGWRKPLYLFHLTASCGTILLTASRGGTISMAIGLTVALWTIHELPLKQRWGLAASAICSALIAVVMIPPTSWNRVSTLFSEVSQGTLNSRTMLWGLGWRAFQDSPFIGVGVGAYPEALEPVLGRPWGFTPVAHNTFISIGVETGLIGFSLFALFLWLTMQAIRKLQPTETRFWLTELATLCIGISSLTWEDRKPTWVVLGLMVAHSAVAQRRAVAKTFTPVAEPVFEVQRALSRPGTEMRGAL